MKLAIQKHFGDFVAIAVLAAIGLFVAGYILANQAARPNFPLIEDKPFELKAEFADAQAVTPGQGQTIRIAGVRVGDITKVELKNGRAIVTMSLDAEYGDRVNKDATALLRPKTGLKDMFIELDPGTRAAGRYGEGDMLPVANTAPDVDPDEILSALDADTRDYLKLLINGAGQGLKGRGDDLNQTFQAFEPLHRDLARVNGAFAKRRVALGRLIHNYSELVTELADKDRELTTLVEASNAVFESFASEDVNLSATVAKLPGALDQTAVTLGKVDRLATTLGPALESLRPAFRQLDTANRQVLPFVTQAEPILRTQIRPFVRQARPYVRDLRPAATGLARALPDLTKSFGQANRLFNLGAYNEGGRQPARNLAEFQSRNEGYLFWLAWVAQNTVSIFSSGDASGPFRRAQAVFSCATITEELRGRPMGEFIVNNLFNLGNVVNDSKLCPR